jgi:hypothetical protein
MTCCPCCSWCHIHSPQETHGTYGPPLEWYPRENRISRLSSCTRQLQRTYLSNMRNKHPANHRTENAKCTGDDERILTSADWVGGIVLRNGQHVSTDKGTDFANGGGDTVVLASNSGCAALGCDKTDVVARTEFTEGGKDAITRQYLHLNTRQKKKAHPKTTTKAATYSDVPSCL